MEHLYSIVVVYNQKISESVSYNALKKNPDLRIIVCDNSTKDFGNEEAVQEYGLDPAEMYDDYVIVPGNRVPFTLTFADDAAIYVQLPEENSVKRQRSVDELLAYLDKYDSSSEHGVFMKVITDKNGKVAFLYEPYRP